jgi:hypothetical protein
MLAYVAVLSSTVQDLAILDMNVPSYTSCLSSSVISALTADACHANWSRLGLSRDAGAERGDRRRRAPAVLSRWWRASAETAGVGVHVPLVSATAPFSLDLRHRGGAERPIIRPIER